MTEYRVNVTQTVSTVVTVEAETVDEALNDYWQAEGMPGPITSQAFVGGAGVDEAGEWEPIEVTDADGNTVWPPVSSTAPAMKHYALMAVDNDVCAVGPFDDPGAASDWVHDVEEEQGLATCRGVVRAMAPTKFVREKKR